MSKGPAASRETVVSERPKAARIVSFFVVELACILCSREVGVFQSATWPAPLSVQVARPAWPPVWSPIGDSFDARTAAAGLFRQRSSSAPSESNHASTGSRTSPVVAARRSGSQRNVRVQEPDKVDSAPPQPEAVPASCSANFAQSEDAPPDGASPPSASDTCGCAPVRTAQRLLRKVKIVFRLEPVDTRLRALVAVGADDCGPELRMLYAADLSAVLQMIPPLVVAAEARWTSQVRYPTASRPAESEKPSRCGSADLTPARCIEPYRYCATCSGGRAGPTRFVRLAKRREEFDGEAVHL